MILRGNKLKTPSQCPDIIENLWSELQMKLCKYETTNVNQLKAKLLLELDNISNDITLKLAQSMLLHGLLETTQHKSCQAKY